MAKRKPPTPAKLKLKLWKVLSRYMRVKYSTDGINVECYTCRANTKIGTSNSQGGHFWNKGAYEALRFDESNIRNQCFACNECHEGEKQIFAERLLEEIGQEEMDRMYDNRKNVIKRNRADIIADTEHYTRELRKLEELHGVEPFKI